MSGPQRPYGSNGETATLCLIGEEAFAAARTLVPDLGGTVRDLGGAAEIEEAAIPRDLAALDLPSSLDVAVIPPGPRRKRLLVADMDSTVIGQECLDELAYLAGHGEEISTITERAMRGELTFEAALISRVEALAGLDAAAVSRVLEEVITLDPGVRTLTATMRSWGATCVLVSGGFTAFTGPVAEEAGFHRHHGNRLDIREGLLTGRVLPPILGREAKHSVLQDCLRERTMSPEDAICVGDGANDIGMIGAVPLGVAYRAKPVVRKAAAVSIEKHDLSALLYLQGVPRRHWQH